MSLILDALRKMEQERKARRAAGDLRPEVLRYRGDVKPQQARPYLLMVSGLVLLLAGVGAGFVLKGHGGATESQSSELKVPSGDVPSATNVAAPPATVVVAPTAPAPPIASASIPTAVPSASVVSRPAPIEATASPEAANEESDYASAPTVARKATRGRKATAASTTVPAEAPRITHVKRPKQGSSEDVQVGSGDITISGIAWQDERHLRRAVLNGSLVGEGAEVAGARVVEIKENKVRLSRGGRLFEVPFSSGLSGR